MPIGRILLQSFSPAKPVTTTTLPSSLFLFFLEYRPIFYFKKYTGSSTEKLLKFAYLSCLLQMHCLIRMDMNRKYQSMEKVKVNKQIEFRNYL